MMNLPPFSASIPKRAQAPRFGNFFLSKLKPSPNQVTGEFRGFHYCAELYHPGSEQDPYQLLVYLYLPNEKGQADEPVAMCSLVGEDIRIQIRPMAVKTKLEADLKGRDMQDALLILMDEILRKKFKKAHQTTYPTGYAAVFQRLSFLKP